MSRVNLGFFHFEEGKFYFKNNFLFEEAGDIKVHRFVTIQGGVAVVLLVAEEGQPELKKILYFDKDGKLHSEEFFRKTYPPYLIAEILSDEE